LAHLPFDIQYNFWWQQFSVIFLRIKLQNFVQLNSIMANWEHAFFWSKQDFSE